MAYNDPPRVAISHRFEVFDRRVIERRQFHATTWLLPCVESYALTFLHLELTCVSLSLPSLRSLTENSLILRGLDCDNQRNFHLRELARKMECPHEIAYGDDLARVFAD
jgi:hypothetical protein